MSLADNVRPDEIDYVVGQEHLLGKGKIIRRLIDNHNIINMIFYGPPGVGKTTVARILAKNSDMHIVELNGTSLKLSDIKDVLEQSNNETILLYIDELQYLNVKQQQSVLEFVENGKVILIGSTTENPMFSLYNALLSRCVIFEFNPVDKKDIIKALERVKDIVSERNNLTWDKNAADKVLDRIADMAHGDVRKSINYLNTILIGKKNEAIDVEESFFEDFPEYSNANQETKYDLLSALQKSIRGSDPDAALFYLAKLLHSGEFVHILRRLLVIASEDIGLAYPNAISIVKSCVDSAKDVGMPEAQIILGEAVLMLALAPKSNSSYLAIKKAMNEVEAGMGGKIPRHLQNNHYDGDDSNSKGQHYKYPHDYPHHYVKQQYLPDDIKDARYYKYGENKQEQNFKNYWDLIKK